MPAPNLLTEPRRPTARGALVRLQARDGSRTSDKLPSLACRASASITGCVRKSLLRLRPYAYLTRDHRLVAALRFAICTSASVDIRKPPTTPKQAFYNGSAGSVPNCSSTRSTRPVGVRK